MRERASSRSLVAVGVALLILAPRLGASADRAGSTLPRPRGWTLSGQPRTFSPTNLYEYVDGAAELYLSLGFQSLQVAEYADGHGGTAVVEIYRHESPVHAFGIYAQERPREGEYLTVGAEGYLAPPYLNFVIGAAYVKLSVDGLGERSRDALRTFAEATCAAIGGDARLPAVLAAFPTDGKVAHSERFAARDFLGYDFLRAGFAADYVVEGRRFQLFAIQAPQQELRAMLNRYLERAGLPATAAPEGHQTVPDKYNGEVAVAWRSEILCGVVGLAEGALRERYLRLLDGALARQP